MARNDSNEDWSVRKLSNGIFLYSTKIDDGEMAFEVECLVQKVVEFTIDLSGSENIT
jgi:hypothetical protein